MNTYSASRKLFVSFDRPAAFNRTRITAVTFSILIGLTLLLLPFGLMTWKPGIAEARAGADQATTVDSHTNSYLIEEEVGKTINNRNPVTAIIEKFQQGLFASSPLMAPQMLPPFQMGLNNLVVTDTVYLDGERYAVTELVPMDSITIPLAVGSNITVGNEILIINMLGTDIGRYETGFVSQVGTSVLTLTAPLIHSYDGTTDKIMVQMVPHYNEVTVESGGKITAHAWDGATGGVVFFRAVTVTVAAGTTVGSISIDSQGYGNNDGPGEPPINVKGGGSYGGYGGLGGSPYGNVYEPAMLGSGGGDTHGGRGGGLIRLVVSDTLIVNGAISANGAQATSQGNNGGGGGSGGSIWITTASITGTGTIRANGGNGKSGSFGNGPGAGGAGGRIAIYVTEAYSLTGAVQTFGGMGSSNSKPGGGAGTIYLQLPNGQDLLQVDNNNITAGGNAALMPGQYEFDVIQLSRHGHLTVISPTSTLTLSNDTLSSGDGTAWLIVEGSTIASEAFTISGAVLAIRGTLLGPESITTTVSGGLELYANTPWHSGVYTFTKINVGANTTLGLIPHDNGNTTYTDDYGVDLRVLNLTVAGHLSSDYLGYNSEEGPGNPPGTTRGGGSYGGYGGQNSSSPYGSPYGDVYEPIYLGSGGDTTSPGYGGRGGGIIRLVVSNTLVISGSITANGENGKGNDNIRGGGGAGGSIWITAGSITGTGTITASGGTGTVRFGTINPTGGGSGGRIAIYATQAYSFSGSIEAKGGTGPLANGGPGTIYLSYPGGQDALLVDNDNVTGASAALIAGEYLFDSIQLTNLGDLTVMTPTSVITLDNATLIAGDGTGRLIGQGTIVAPTNMVINGAIVAVQGHLSGPENITTTVSGGLELYADNFWNSGVYTFTEIHVGDNTILGFVPFDNDNGVYTDDYGAELRLYDLTVEQNGMVSADGQGYALQQGPGANDSGSSHGGYGGGGEPPYGDVYYPVTLGSSGNSNRGGGPIHLFITNTLTLSGSIQSNGNLDGSGGSIWLEAGTLIGNGTIEANGGTGGGAGGGGGRIAIYATDWSGYTGAFEADFGGMACPQSIFLQCNGTIYLDGVDPVTSTIAVDPAVAPANGIQPVVITVTLKANDRTPLSGQPVTLFVAPTANVFINGLAATNGVSIGQTDANGMVTATMTTTVAGTKIVGACSGPVCLQSTAEIVFQPSTLDPDTSTVTAEGGLDTVAVAADGVTTATIIVTARDQFGNVIPGVSTALNSPTGITITPVNENTNASGQAVYWVSHNQPAEVIISATVNSLTVGNVVTVTFLGAGLSVNKTGPSEVPAGLSAIYSIDVANQGVLTATNVVVTDVLPAATSFVTSSYTHTYYAATNTVVWQVGTLPPGSNVAFSLEALVDLTATVGSMITNTISATLAEIDLYPNDNQDSASTLVEAPIPILEVSPIYPTLVVSQGFTNSLVITVTNRGSADLLDATAVSPPNLPWVTLSSGSPGTIAPGASVVLTITADSSAISEPGHYRDRVTITSTNAGNIDIYLTVYVRPPLRDLQLQLTNDFGAAVSNGHVILTELILVVTEGVTGTESYYHEGNTDENGYFTFYGLETGKAYGFDITAPQHQGQTGFITVTEGVLTQVWPVTLTGFPGLALEPNGVTIHVTPGGTAQELLTILNTGVVTLTDIAVTTQGIDFVYLEQLPAGTAIPPGSESAVAVNAAPSVSETADIYLGTIQVTAAGDLTATVPLTVELQSEAARDLCITVKTTSGNPLSDASVRLTDLTGQVVVSGGVTETIQYVEIQTTDNLGEACFSSLEPGPYQADVSRGEINLGGEMLDVVPGDGTQEETIYVDEPSLLVNWTVTPDPFDDVYTTVMTLTFIPHATPRLGVTPSRVNLCNDPDGVVTETLTIHNFYPVTLNNAILELQTLGNVSAQVATQDGSASTNGTIPLYLGTIDPNEDLSLDLTASLNSLICSGDEGLVFVTVSAEYNHYQPTGWYNLFGDVVGGPGGGVYLPGQEAHIPLRLANVGFPEDSNLNSLPPDLVDVTLTPPQQLTWMSVSTTTFATIPVSEEVGFDLIVNPPPWLTQGFYYDHIKVTASNGITAFIGIEAEMTATGLRVEAQFVTPVATGSGGGGSSGGSGSGNPPFGSTQPPNWSSIVNNLNSGIFTPQDILVDSWEIEVGCYCSSGGGGWSAVGNHLVYTQIGSSPGPGIGHSSDFKDNVVILLLQQKYSLEREAFTAQLALGNGLAESITDLSVEIIFTDSQSQPVPLRSPGDVLTSTGTFSPALPQNSVIPTSTIVGGMPTSWQQNYPVNFIIIPETPTGSPDLPSGTSYNASWTLIPDAMGLTEQAQFQVQAVINYKVNGVPKSVTTSPAPVTVNPAPRIVLDYYIPNYVLGGQTFDWLVVATNVGYGTANNFRVETPQPVILKQSDLYPTDFTLIGPSILNFGDVPSGGQVSGAWRILPSEPGMFVGWSASCKHQNYKGVTLPPLVYCNPNVHFLDTSYLAEAQQWSKNDSCMTGLFQGFDSDPVNTFSGNFTYSAMDVSIPSWGMPLEFERSYNSRGMEDGPFGPGWTHNYNMFLTYESFIAMQGGVAVGQQNMFITRLPHGSLAYFDVSADGETITPFPGVRAQLTRDFTTYTLTQECEQILYTFNAEQKLTTIEDANGNQITLSYDINGNLDVVTGTAGRTLNFEYDGDGHITRMTDPLGRSYIYTYTNGYLSSMADFRGEVTQFTYTPPQGSEPGQLVSIMRPNGTVEVYNHYDAQRRVDWQEDALQNRTAFDYIYTPLTETQKTIITDPLGNVMIDTYDGDGLLVRREDHYGFFEAYEYDDHYNMIQLTDKNGHVTEYDWNDCNCDIEQITDPLDNVMAMVFNEQNQVIMIVDERGYTTTIEYDASTNPLTITNALGDAKRYTYGQHGELLSETDENGNTTHYAYDDYSNTVIITDALSNVTYLTYDLAGRLLSTTDALSRTTTYTYDDGDNLLAVVGPLTTMTSYSYDSIGNLLTTIDALSRTTTYTYNDRNELIQTIDPLNGVHTFVYDDNGNLLAETDALSRTTTYQYDALDRLLVVTDPLTGTVVYSYDPVGNILTEKDPNGNTTGYVYDDNDRRTKTTFADGSQMTATYDDGDNLLTLTDAEGRIVSYTYDQVGRLIVHTDPLTGTTTYDYDAAGNRTSMIDAEGRETLYTYDELNRVVQATDPLSGTTTILYDAAGNKVSVTDSLSRTWLYVYDDLDRLIEVTDPLSGTTRYAYDAIGNQIQITDPLSRVTRIDYDDLNRPVTVTDALSGVVVYEYDAVGNVLQFIDEEGRLTRYGYDALNRTISVTNPMNGVITYTWDANGNRTSDTDPEGRTTTYAYDVLDQLISITDPLDGVTRYGYDLVGNLVVLTDTNGNATQYAYDGLDRVVVITDALTNTTTYTYDAVGNMLAVTDAEGNTTAYAYDALNRPITVTDALSGVTSYEYDAVGNLLAVTDAEERRTNFVYDGLDRLILTTDPLSNTTAVSYDAAGNQLSSVNARGFTTTFEYDALNRPVTTTDALSGTTVYTYSAVGNLLAVRNPLGQITLYGYDDLDRTVVMTDALGQAESYAYDQVGNLLTVTDAADRILTTTYDDLNRPLTITDPLGGVSSFTYDAVGNQLSSVNANNQTISYTYDVLNRLVTITDPLGQTTHFGYDKVGNQVSLTDPLSRTITYTYDSLYRLVTVEDPAGGLTTYTYDAVGNQVGMVDAEERPTTIAYDALNRPVTVTNALSGTTIFVYDEVGNQINVIDPEENVFTYTYNALNRLATMTDPLAGVIRYDYDALGNLLRTTDALTHSVTYQYDVLNRPITITNELSGTTRFSYDAVGNLTLQVDPLGNETQYEYDVLNRAITVTDALTGTSVFDYDAIGNLLSTTDANEHTSSFVYDDLNRLITATNPLSETTVYGYDAVGNTVAITDSLGNRTGFVYDELDRLVSVTDPLTRTTTYSYDAVGNQVGMVGAAGVATRYIYDDLDRLIQVTENYAQGQPGSAITNVVTLFDYDNIGNLTVITNSLGNAFTFTYDALNRVVGAADPLGNLNNYTYDPVGNLTQMVDANEQTTNYAYDGLNRLAIIARPDETITYTYDAVGNRLAMGDPTGVTVYTYDDLYRPTSVTDPMSQLVQYGYDPVGNRVNLTYPDGKTVTYTHDAANQLVGILDWDNGQTAYTYDAGGRLIQTTLPNGVTTTLDYDAAGQLTAIQHTSLTNTLSSYTYTYDAVGNRIGVVEMVSPATNAFQEIDGLVVMEAENFHASMPRNGQEWTVTSSFAGYEGDAYVQALPDLGNFYTTGYTSSSPELEFQVNFVTTGTYNVWIYGASTGAAADSLHVGLDGAANSSSDGLTGFPFNEWGWTAATMDGVTATVTISTPGLHTIHIYAREDGLRLDRVLLTLDGNYVPTGGGPDESPQGGAVAGLLPGNQGDGQNPNHALAWAMILGNPGLLMMGPLGVVAPLAYRRRRRKGVQIFTVLLLVLVLGGVGAALFFGAAPLAAAPAMQASSFGSPTTITYTYDPLYRLTGANYNSGESFNYTYDAAGNRLAYNINSTQVATYTYDIANRLTQVTGVDLATYTYDDNGNLLDDGQNTYDYDSANRLVEVDDGISTIDYIYNGDGVRTAQIVDGLRTDYVQDVVQPLPQLLTASQGGTVTRYLRGLGLVGEQRGTDPAAWQYNIPDALGSVRQVVDPQGQVTLARNYDPFGGLLSSSDNATTAYGFAGEEQDPTTDQLYLRARNYNPSTGRFLQQDSVAGNPAEPRSLHRYAYAFNNPVNYTDPSGRMPPQVASNGPLYSGGSINTPQVNGNGANPFFNQPTRSANNGNWSTYSNPLARLQSGGLRPFFCGMAGMMVQGLEWVMQNPDLAIGAAIIAGSIALTGGASIPFIVAGAAFGAGIGYGYQAYDNYRQGMSVFEMFYRENIDWDGVGRAAFHGAVSGAIAGVIEPFFAAGSGLIRVGATAVGEFVSGRAYQVASNVMIGRQWDEEFWNLRDIALDVLPGVGATLIKPVFKGAKNFISGGIDRWRLTQRLDDFVTQGRPVNLLNRFRADADILSRKVKSGLYGLFARHIQKPLESNNIRAWLGQDTPHLNALPYIEATRGAEVLNRGWEKKVYNVKAAEGHLPENLAWLQPEWWGAPTFLEDELANLAELAKRGLPTVRNIGKTDVQGILGINKTIVLQERMFPLGSKQIIRINMNRNQVGNIQKLKSSPLNQRTLEDLQNIRQTLVDLQLGVHDTQFLVSQDGRVFFSDPKEIKPEALEKSLEHIDNFMKAVQRAIALRK